MSLTSASQPRRKLGEILVAGGAISEHQLTRALAERTLEVSGFSSRLEARRRREHLAYQTQSNGLASAWDFDDAAKTL